MGRRRHRPVNGDALHKAPLFNTPEKLDLFRDTTFELLHAYSINLRAWAFLNNHYHLIAGFADAACDHRTFLRHSHREIALRLNKLDATPGRKVIYQFWDSELTFEKSYLARLHYVHHNPVHRQLVPVASQYPWCSARWFETSAPPAFVKTVYSFKTDKVNVPDEF